MINIPLKYVDILIETLTFALDEYDSNADVALEMEVLNYLEICKEEHYD